MDHTNAVWCGIGINFCLSASMFTLGLGWKHKKALWAACRRADGGRLVKTEFEVGLTEAQADQAIAMLGKSSAENRR